MGRGETEMQLQNPSKQVYDFVRPLCGGRFVKDDGQSLFSGITCESEIMGGTEPRVKSAGRPRM